MPISCNFFSVLILLFAESFHLSYQGTLSVSSRPKDSHIIGNNSSNINNDAILQLLLATNSSAVLPMEGRQESNNRFPCTCSNGLCSCCTGPILNFFGQKACMKVRYHPEDFAFDVTMTMNDNILYENTMSGKIPRPACISPPRLSQLKVCAQMSNVYFPGRNIHFCIDMIGKWSSAMLFDISFDCLRMGAQGIALVKPEDGPGIPVATPVNTYGGLDADVDAGEEDIEDYDEHLVRSVLDVLEY